MWKIVQDSVKKLLKMAFLLMSFAALTSQWDAALSPRPPGLRLRGQTWEKWLLSQNKKAKITVMNWTEQLKRYKILTWRTNFKWKRKVNRKIWEFRKSKTKEQNRTKEKKQWKTPWRVQTVCWGFEVGKLEDCIFDIRTTHFSCSYYYNTEMVWGAQVCLGI